MSRKHRRELTSFLVVVTVYFYTFSVCHSVSLGRREDDFRTRESTAAVQERIQQHNDAQQGLRHLVEQVIRGPNLRNSNHPGIKELRFESETLPTFDELDSNFVMTVGNISRKTRSSASDSGGGGYHADPTGFDVVQGKVVGPSVHSSPHFPEWLAMRPLVQCDGSVMTFTATGQGFTHLLVDRGGASPISLFQLPPYCGYSVRTSWRDLEIIVPYDACYITQENGSYVLPLLWWGSPLKLSCPLQMLTPAPPSSRSAPLVLCSPYGMAVQIHGQEQDIPMLGVIVNGGWGPFVSEECAYYVHSHLGELAFFIPYSAPCITSGDGFHLHLILDDQGYILSCPVHTQFPNSPDPVSPASTSPPPPSPLPPTQGQIAQLPDHLHYPYPGLQHPQLPQIYPPGPQPAHPPQPTPGSAPGPQQQQSLYSIGPGKLPKHPVQDSSPHQVPKLPVGPYQYPSGVYYYPAVTPAPTPAPKETATTVPPATHPPKLPASHYYPHYYLQMPYYAEQVTQAPAPPPSPPKQSIYFPLPPAKEKPQTIPQEPQTPAPLQAICPPYAHTICSNYPYSDYHPLYPPHYHSPYPPVPQYPPTQPPMATTTSPTTTSTPTEPPPQVSHLQCLMGRMVVFLPFAHPDSIQVRDQMKTWLFLSSISPLCEYILQVAEGSGVILHSPLPACHSQPWTPTHISLPLRFWDLSTAQYRTLDLQCPYQTTHKTPAPVTPSVSPTPPRTTKGKGSPSDVPKPKVFCFFDQMTVELPSGPISEIVIEDVKGNQMNLQDAPKHCGYSAIKGKGGKIRLSLQLHQRCHMSVQDKMYLITVHYMTENGRQEAQFSCPVVTSVSGQQCNFPSEQRLPCGPGSVSEPQCLSMGCCFSKHPPACYYPMDECTIDRHFVFSVPASLTEPPLSPAQLVTSGNSTCKPQRVTSDYALFKIPMDGCGTRRFMVGKTVIYMVEVINKVHAISLNYGTITRDSPVRLWVECRFLPSTVLSVSYMVKTPTLGPEVQNQGIFGVQLRIAKDAHYSSYHPQYHQPLQMLLGKPLYLEVRLLNSPDPSLVLLVHFCVAYPRSGKAVWLLLYNGCPNPLDPASQQAVLLDPRPPSPQGQTHRFTISTFQFLPDGEFKDTDEEIYFMCSTEICSRRDGPCVEGCFGH